MTARRFAAERQSAVLDAALDCVITIDARGRVTYFNPAAERTFGYEADDVLGREMAEVIVPPTLREKHRRGLAQHLATGEKHVLDRRIELTAMRADGSEFPAELTVTRVDGSSEEPAFTGYVRDITERRQAEQDLLAARGDLAAVADEQAALRRVATLVAQEATPAEVFAMVAKEVAQNLDVALVSIVRCEAGVAIQVGAWGEGNPFPVGTSWMLDGHGVSGRVSLTGEPARVDYANVPGDMAARLSDGAGIRCAVGVPIMVEGSLWGVMMALSTERADLPERIEDQLAGFTELVATAIANTQARDELRQLVNEQSALRRVATLVAEDAAPRDVFDAVCEETGRLMGATVVNLVHFTAGGLTVTVAGWSLEGNRLPPGARIPVRGETIDLIIQGTRAPARVAAYEGVEGELAQLLSDLDIKAEAGAPVIVEGRVWGALIAGARSAEVLPKGAEARVARFAELIATAVSNAIARSELIAARRRVIEAGDAARRRLTRDLHDGAQRDLVNVLLNLQLAQERWDDRPGAREFVDRAAAEAQASIDELRDLAAGLHPEILTNLGLAAATEGLTEALPLPVTTEGLPERRLPQEIEASIYFFISEALTNVVKHAEASSARVKASLDDARLTVEVSDDGIGGAEATAGGSGLVGLGDRIAALDGAMTIESEPGEGTTLHAVVPLGSPVQAAEGSAVPK